MTKILILGAAGSLARVAITHKGKPFKGSSVSCLSIADFICKMATTDNQYVHKSIGISRP